MKLGVLVTNNGKHSDEKLAVAVAGDLVQVGADAAHADAMDARKLENQIIDVMEGFFAKLSAFEHAAIAEKGTAHLAAPVEAHPELLNGAISEITKVIAASPFASWFKPEETEALVRQVVSKWLVNAHHMHRDYFAKWGQVGNHTTLTASDKHDPDCVHVKAWLGAPAPMTIGLNLPS